MTQQEFSRRFKGSPIKRAKRRGFLRNVLVAIGNWGEPRAVPPLKDALADDEPLVRSHAAWALGKIGGDTATQILQTRLTIETEQEVITENSETLFQKQSNHRGGIKTMRETTNGHRQIPAPGAGTNGLAWRETSLWSVEGVRSHP